MFCFLRWILNPRTWLRWPWQKARGIAWPVVFILTLGYRPGHPWSGLVALGICVGIVACLWFLCVFLRGVGEARSRTHEQPDA